MIFWWSNYAIKSSDTTKMFIFFHSNTESFLILVCNLFSSVTGFSFHPTTKFSFFFALVVQMEYDWQISWYFLTTRLNVLFFPLLTNFFDIWTENFHNFSLRGQSSHFILWQNMPFHFVSDWLNSWCISRIQLKIFNPFLLWITNIAMNSKYFINNIHFFSGGWSLYWC